MYDFITNDEELIGIVVGDGAEIVSDVLTARLAHALQAIDHLREGIDDEEVPSTLLHAEHGVDAAQGDNLLATLALYVLSLAFCLQGSTL